MHKKLKNERNKKEKYIIIEIINCQLYFLYSQKAIK